MTSTNKPPSFVRSGSSSLTANSMHAPTAVSSFAATNRSVSSTPQGTPPPPHLASMDNNAPVMIYTAVYSGVPVFEMTVNNIAVMRRRDDSWLNATQILKVAGIDKGKRTKVLEKEILIGKHEKIQGGYGKYQGTWIDYARGREFCRAYGVEELLAPLLNLDVKAGPDSTPTKEQAMAAKRKRMYNPSLNKTNGSAGPVFPISSAVTSAFNALSKAKSRKESPVPPRHSQMGSAPSSQGTVRPDMNITMASQETRAPPPSLYSESSFNFSQGVPDSAYASQNAVLADSQQTEPSEPPAKRVRESTPSNKPLSNVYSQSDASSRPLPPLNADNVPNAEQVKQSLLDVFVHEDIDAMVALDGITVEQVNLRLDLTGNAAIHWAASLARVPLLQALVAKGASIYRVNDAGETALVRGCMTTNNYDRSSFPQLLLLLHPTISIADNTGRTLLHHIALKSGMKGRSADGRYYLHCLLEFVAKHGASSGQQNGSQKVMNLGKFITDIVNAQDKTGDTALNIAARIGNKSIVQQLLEVGADSNIPNRAGLRPVDFGIGGEPVPLPRGREQAWTVPPAVIEKREDIVKGMKETIADIEKEFQAEVEQKQEQNEATLNQLREVTLKLGKERERANMLSQKSREHAELRQHCQNLRRAITEEAARFHENFATNGNIPSAEEGEKNPDLPYAMRTQLLPPISDASSLTPQQRDYLRSLPSANVLKARLKAYKTNASVLKDRTAKLHERSTDLEEKFRRVVALCTNVPEDRVDLLLEGLVQAVESDPGEVDTARVSTFLRKVDESIGPD